MAQAQGQIEQEAGLPLDDGEQRLRSLLRQSAVYVGFVVNTSTAETNRVNGAALLKEIEAELGAAA